MEAYYFHNWNNRADDLSPGSQDRPVEKRLDIFGGNKMGLISTLSRFSFFLIEKVESRSRIARNCLPCPIVDPLTPKLIIYRFMLSIIEGIVPETRLLSVTGLGYVNFFKNNLRLTT
jgi:hypothetical protein